MAATMQQVVTRFMEEVGREEPHFLTRSDSSLFVNSQGTLYYDREGRGSWGRGTPQRNIPLAMFIGNRFKGGFMLLNGDGMEDNLAMTWQTRVREQAQNMFSWQKCAIIPFSALNAAEFDYYSLRIIEVTQDRQDQVTTWIDGLHKALVDLRKDPAKFINKHKLTTWGGYTPWDVMIKRGETSNSTLLTGTVNKRQIRVELMRNDVYSDADFMNHFTLGSISLFAQPENGQATWHSLRFSTDRSEWYWMQAVHRLGAVVFSGTDIHGDKARWLSAFDMHEPEPLYFLAQLPKQGKINNYDEALFALAPPMVQTANAKSTPVFRQGDVFAVETDWTDEQVYAVAKTRVSRSVALQNVEEMYAIRAILNPPGPNEVTEKVKCPHCSGGKVEVGCGPTAKEALMILHTGHTANEVVQTEDGRTFIKGAMHHDPHLETPGRVPDHRAVALNVGKWYLCIRNTVPRQKDRVTAIKSDELKIPMPRRDTRGHDFFTSEELRRVAHPPKGYLFVEHRVPKNGDTWLTNAGSIRSTGTSSSTGMRKRWILRPVTTEAEAQAA